MGNIQTGIFEAEAFSAPDHQSFKVEVRGRINGYPYRGTGRGETVAAAMEIAIKDFWSQEGKKPVVTPAG
jgi:hypothetical protein